MALALADVGCADEMRKVAPRMAEQIREAISAQRGRKGVFCPEALQVRHCCMCVSRNVASVEDRLHPPAVHCGANIKGHKRPTWPQGCPEALQVSYCCTPPIASIIIQRLCLSTYL